MSIFQNDTNYYDNDNLYHNKDYIGECAFLEEIFHKYYKKSIKTILDLGCGSGSHALVLSKKGYQITGVDLSSKMVEITKRKEKINN